MSLPIHVLDISFHVYRSSLISLTKVLSYAPQNYCICSVRFMSHCLVFLMLWQVVPYKVGEGNDNRVQCSCLENPVGRGAWWTAVRRVSQSRTRLKWLNVHACIRKGNGNPLQCSCLENSRDGGAWWAGICGVTQSWTQLK